MNPISLILATLVNQLYIIPDRWKTYHFMGEYIVDILLYVKKKLLNTITIFNIVRQLWPKPMPDDLV